MDTVLLTGAASGIGRATAWRLARLGHRCVLVDRNADALHALLQQLQEAAPVAHAPHLARVVDLTDPEKILALADGLPPLDALINNAGMTDASNLPVIEQAEDNWQRLLDLNLHAPARLLNALHDRLAKDARIVNVASGAGLRAIPWRGAYSPSKAGLIAHTRAVAHAYPELRVSVLCPGFVQTELVDGLIASGRLDPARAVAKIPLGRLADPDDIACALTFLASRDAAPLSGGQLCVDGGSSIFGGSQAYMLTGIARLASDTPLRLRVRGRAWPGVEEDGRQSGDTGAEDRQDRQRGYPARADTQDTRCGESATLEMPDRYRGEPTALGSPDTYWGYPAMLDTTVLDSAPGERLAATLAAARRHDARGPGSLTVVLPRPSSDWQHAGDDAAARMLISTLAAEWGPAAHRINAVEVDATHGDAQARDARNGGETGANATHAGAQLAPLLRFVAGAQAQYLTGQTLCTR